MRRLAGVLLLLACVQTREVDVTFGSNGEGLDGFLCKASGDFVLNRLATYADAGPGPTTATASLVTDFVRLGGLPGCRTSQLVDWCSTHQCVALPGTRKCNPIRLPTGLDAGTPREDVRDLVQQQFKSLSGDLISNQAPDEIVLLRVIATAASCEEVLASDAYDKAKLVGCAYSCPTLFSQVGQDVYLGFDTLVGACEQGLRTCSDNELRLTKLRRPIGGYADCRSRMAWTADRAGGKSTPSLTNSVRAFSKIRCSSCSAAGVTTRASSAGSGTAGSSATSA